MRCGRVQTQRARREELLDEFERSGASGQAFAAMVGVKYQTFASWIQKRRRARGQYPAAANPTSSIPATGALRLVEAVIDREPPTGRTEIVADGLCGASARWSACRDLRCAASTPGGGASASVGDGITLMLSFTGGLKVFIALEPCDLRKSFNGLHSLVSERLGEDPRVRAVSSSLPTGARPG